MISQQPLNKLKINEINSIENRNTFHKVCRKTHISIFDDEFQNQKYHIAETLTFFSHFSKFFRHIEILNRVLINGQVDD